MVLQFPGLDTSLFTFTTRSSVWESLATVKSRSTRKVPIFSQSENHFFISQTKTHVMSTTLDGETFVIISVFSDAFLGI